MSSEQYCKELSGVVALPDMCQCALIDFANRIRVAILSEQGKINPNNALISLLCDAARIGYEYGECAQGNLELAQQHLTQQGSEPTEISALVSKTIDDLRHGCGPNMWDFLEALQKLLPC